MIKTVVAAYVNEKNIYTIKEPLQYYARIYTHRLLFASYRCVFLRSCYLHTGHIYIHTDCLLQVTAAFLRSCFLHTVL